MNDKKTIYLESLSGKISALEAAQKNLVADQAGATATIKRIATALRTAHKSSANLDVVNAALPLSENIGVADLEHGVEMLLVVLRKACAESEATRVEVLVIEDDPTLREDLRQHLVKLNKKVLTAGTASQAREIVEREHISLIILDLFLPDEDGRNLLAHFRASPRAAGTTVIVLSTQFGAQVESECLALGADEFFVKPVDFNTLSAAVARKLQRVAEISLDLYRDPLTGCVNRRALQEMYTQMRSLADRTRSPSAVGIIDLDYFKAINDAHGHDMGDRVLKRVAELFRDGLRKSDMVARWGGEEFVVLLPNTRLDGAALAMENLLRTVRGQTFTAPSGREFKVSFSAGVCEVQPGATLEKSVAAADKLLYRAKAMGRQRVVSLPDESIPELIRIILVEDDEIIATVIRNRLKKENIDVVHFTDGLVAESEGPKTAAKLIILDANLPGRDGFQILQSFRQSGEHARTPIIMVTAMGSEKDVVRGLTLGADDYVLKPFSPDELALRIKRLLKRI